MKKIHPLAEKVYQSKVFGDYVLFGSQERAVDEMVREWLTEKAKEIWDEAILKMQVIKRSLSPKDIKQILCCLEDSEEVKEEKKVEWCEHITWRKCYDHEINGEYRWVFDGRRISNDFNMCPIVGCHAKRPEPKKRKELWEVFEIYFNDVVNDLRIDGRGEYFRGLAKTLAIAAEKWFKEQKV